MAISGFDDQEVFAEKLNMVLSASRPIRSIQFLYGREKYLQDIAQDLSMSGRNIFIYGERGVGKSSLAATAAYQYQSSNAEPIFVSGSSTDNFETVTANIASQLLNRSRITSQIHQRSVSLNLRCLETKLTTQVKPLDITQSKTIGEVAILFKEILEKFETSTIVVIDEFDTIPSAEERGKFASLLKLLGDQGCNLKFIFTGVASTIEELLGAHNSSFRQLSSIQLPKLPIDARKEIASKAAEAFDLHLDYDVSCRIALISDGYPYYVHLIVERMLWVAFTAEEPVIDLDWDIFNIGLKEAIARTATELQQPYKKAVLSRGREYEDAIWATANSDDSYNESAFTYLSYKEISRRRPGGVELQRDRFSKLLRDFRKPSFGAILIPLDGRPGWFSYREKMLRGYVRMQAEASGITLDGSRPNPKQVMHGFSNAKTGYYGPSIPIGVRTQIKISEWEDG